MQPSKKTKQGIPLNSTEDAFDKPNLRNPMKLHLPTGVCTPKLKSLIFCKLMSFDCERGSMHEGDGDSSSISHGFWMNARVGISFDQDNPRVLSQCEFWCQITNFLLLEAVLALRISWSLSCTTCTLCLMFLCWCELWDLPLSVAVLPSLITQLLPLLQRQS